MKMLTKAKKACCESGTRGEAAVRIRGPAGAPEAAAQCCAKSSRLVTGCHD